MLSRETFCVRSLLTVVGLAAPAFLAPIPAAQAQTATQASADVMTTLNRAADLLAEGKAVQARRLLAPLAGGADLPDGQRTRLHALLSNASNRIRSMSPVDVSLQTAEDCLARQDYLTLRRHAQGVIEAPRATNAQADQARELLAAADKAQAEFAPQVPAKLAAASAAWDAGRTAECRTLLDEINRSGVTLDEGQSRTLASLQGSIFDLETSRRDAGMMQPGVIKKRSDEPAQPASQPASEPAAAQPASEPAPAQPPATQPEAQPATQPASEPAPQPVDPIAEARKFEAQALLSEGDVAFDQSKFADAASKYQKVLSSYADVVDPAARTHAEQRLTEAKLRLNMAPGSGANLLDNQLGSRQIAHDQTLAEFENFLAQASGALAGGDAKAARDLAAQANLRLNSGRQFLSETEMAEMATRVGELRTAIDRAEDDIRARQIADRERRLAEEAARIKASTAATKAEKINEAVQRVRALQREMKYEEALQVVEQILFLDPINPTGLVLRDILIDTIISQKYGVLERRKQININEHELANAEAIVPPVNILGYSSDWPAISYRRGEPIAFNDTEENRRALAVIERKKIPVNFTDTPLTTVIGFLKAVTNLDFDVDYQSLELVSIDRESPVTLNLTNVPIRTILDRVVERVSPDAANGAAWSINDGVITVASKEVINRNRVLVIYDIRDLLIEVPDYNQAPEFDLQAVLQSTGQQGGGSGQSPFRDNQQGGGLAGAGRRSLEDRTNDLIQIITTNVDQEGWQENGGQTGFIQQLQGNLIITQTPANHREVHGLLSKLRESRAMQVNVETRFLLVAQDFFEQIGVDLDVYFNGDNNQQRIARATRPTNRPSDFFRPDGSISPTFPTTGTGANTNNTPLPSPLSVIGAGQNSLGLVEGLLGGDFGPSLISASPALGIGGEFLDDIQVDFLVKATQADRRSVTLTAPRLTFTNGQTSNIYVATQVAFVSDLQPIVSESAVGFDPELNAVNEGVRLLVDGTISADRRYVTLNVDASIAKIDGFGTQPVTAIAGGQLVNSAATQSFIQVPTTTVTRVQTTVTVPDQGTILLGGQRLVTEQEAETGVPVLSKIPILNRFFSNRVMSKEEQTLLILLKPTILIQNEEEERNFPGLADSLRLPG
ncbi:MAG: hypothetical protein IT433_04505 [Phycisphaerales bacterium]|nr:hypothetical protein [Phycisphaerales bacterium]